ncbi:MAG: hypothetical protein ACRD3W_23175, partial [Terriglobales bacterium]
LKTMAISFPLSHPSSPAGFSTFTQGATNVVGISSSPFTGQQQAQEWSAELWDFSVGLPPMKRADAEAWVSFLVALRGMSGTFLIGDPYGAAPRGVATGTPKVSGSNAAGSKTFATKGWTHGVTGILKAGDYIQVGTGMSQRLYKNLTDVDSDGSGDATLDIFPRLREALADDAVITTTNCKGCFRLADNRREWSVALAGVYGLSFRCVEAF